MTQWSSLASMTPSSHLRPAPCGSNREATQLGKRSWHRTSGRLVHGSADVLRRGCAVGSVDDEMLGPEGDVVAWTELAASHAGPVDLGSVGGLEILKDPSSVSEHEPGVATRDRQV